MLDAIRKKFFATQKEEVEMIKETEQEVSAKELASEVVADATLSSALAAATELNASQAAALADLTSKFEAAQAALAEIEAAKAALIAEAAEKKLAARKEKVEMAIGTAKAPALLAATESLDDVAFEAVVAAMAGSVEAESKTDLFREIGASGSVDASKVVDSEGAVMKALKTKYAK